MWCFILKLIKTHRRKHRGDDIALLCCILEHPNLVGWCFSTLIGLVPSVCVSLDGLLKWWKSVGERGGQIISQGGGTICPGAHPRAPGTGEPAKIKEQTLAVIEEGMEGE